jgi:hypothetical protein
MTLKIDDSFDSFIPDCEEPLCSGLLCKTLGLKIKVILHHSSHNKTHSVQRTRKILLIHSFKKTYYNVLLLLLLYLLLLFIYSNFFSPLSKYRSSRSCVGFTVIQQQTNQQAN